MTTTPEPHVDYWRNDEAYSLGDRPGVSPVLNVDQAGRVWISPPPERPGDYPLDDAQVAVLLAFLDGHGRGTIEAHAHPRVAIERQPNGAGHLRLYGVYGDQRAEVDVESLRAWLREWTA